MDITSFQVTILIMETVHPGRFFHTLDENRIQCDLCPRECRMKEGQRGLCFIRFNRNGKMVLGSYGKNSGLAVDPIEKKPLFHFYPGSRVLSFGTAGCNLSCGFCQNWHISRSKELDQLSGREDPVSVAEYALRTECRSVAFTYNDPIIFHEYAVDTAVECRKRGIKTVAVTSGYVNPEPRKEFYENMDAANVDLKGFTEEFYKNFCSGKLAPVLDTLEYIKKETDVWLEITNLIIPGANDSTDELERMTSWIVEKLGPDVPVHFTAFHPDFKLMDRERTPLETLIRAREIALKNGIHYPYTGNLRNHEGESTLCPFCGSRVIARDGFRLAEVNLAGNKCLNCGGTISGIFT